LISAQNGDLDDLPSFVIKWSTLTNPSSVAALNRLQRWLGIGENLYRVEFNFDIKTNESPDEIWKILANFWSSLRHCEVELFTLRGTCNIEADKIRGHDKICTRILRTLADDSKFAESLMRLEITECFVDFDTLATLPNLVKNSQISSLRLANLKLGLHPSMEPIVVELKRERLPMQKALEIKCAKSGCCSCWCCPAPAYDVKWQDAKDDIDAGMKQFVAAHKDLTGSHTGAESLVQVFETMAARHPDVVDMTGTHLPSFCGSVTGVRDVMRAIAASKASAITLIDTGLTDVHIMGIADAFFQNRCLLHFSASLTCAELTGIEVLQSIVQNSPMLVSGSFTTGEPLKMTFAKPIETEHVGPQKQQACCLGMCFKQQYSVHRLTQTVSEHQFPATVRGKADFDMYNGALSNEIKEHGLVPMFTVLSSMWNGDSRKMKNLERAAKHPAVS